MVALWCAFVAPPIDTATPSAAGPILVESSVATGLTFTHVNGATGEYYIAEEMGAGVALIDYDNDGDLDVFFVQGGTLTPGLPGRVTRGRGAGCFATTWWPTRTAARNCGSPTSPSRRTSDTVTFGMGVATADYDGDGDVDLLVTSFGPETLYRNNGDGTFTDVTATAGIYDQRWSTSAAFVDADRDGRLDLFVANYLDFTIAGNRRASIPSALQTTAHLASIGRCPRASTGISGTAPSATRRNRPASARRTAPASASRPAITTAMDGRTSSWPMTRPRTSSG